MDDADFARYLMNIAVVDTFHLFKGYLSARFNVHIVLAYEDEDWICFCQNWMKAELTPNDPSKVCEHVVGIRFLCGENDLIPLEARSVPLGEKAKRGRPCKIKPGQCLQKDNDHLRTAYGSPSKALVKLPSKNPRYRTKRKTSKK